MPSLETERRVSAAGLRAPALVGAAGLGAAVLLHLHDPHQSGSYGYCPFLQLTGKPCPGCGGLRAVNDLTRGDVVGAAGSNLLAVALVAVLAVAWVLWVGRRLRGRPDGMLSMSLRTGLVVIGVIAIFGILRVTPWGSWLAP
ncbi:DUF2752 domain-containing protein [Aeromicrobium sp. NPDC092404]|uniref:DUF2752 domain-containing protein n=1 Tax=Aeromicrobium sp. NPDC092404 TaxID=3154976 RepID=UPI003440D614